MKKLLIIFIILVTSSISFGQMSNADAMQRLHEREAYRESPAYIVELQATIQLLQDQNRLLLQQISLMQAEIQQMQSGANQTNQISQVNAPTYYQPQEVVPNPPQYNYSSDLCYQPQGYVSVSYNGGSRGYSRSCVINRNVSVCRPSGNFRRR